MRGAVRVLHMVVQQAALTSLPTLFVRGENGVL